MQESYQYDSQCIFIDFMPQIAFKKNENKFYLCLRQHRCIWGMRMNIFMNNSAVWKDTITRRQRVSESNFLLFNLLSFSWYGSFSVHLAFFSSLIPKHNTLEKHRVSYWIMIAPLHQFPVNCLLGDLETHIPTRTTTKVLKCFAVYWLPDTVGFSCRSILGFYM